MTIAPDETLVVALVDDDDLFRETLVALLARDSPNILVRQACDAAGLSSILKSETQVDCVVLDLNLGAESGLAVHQQLRELYADPPAVVMLTGSGSERIAIKAFRGGFGDYVSKQNLSSGELLKAVHNAVARKRTEDLQKSEIARLKKLTLRDSESGLFTHDHIQDLLSEDMNAARRANKVLTVVLISPNQLEHIRDRYGQAIATRALQAFSARLKGAVRPGDRCGRYGPETFLYLFVRALSRGQISAEIPQLTGLLSFEVNFEALVLRMSARLGVASFPSDGQTVDELLRTAAAQLDGDPALNEGREMSDQTADAATREGSREAPSSPVSVQHPGGGTERRRESRRRVFKQGRIVLSESGSVIDCTIREMSESGARIRVDSYFALPNVFDLEIVGTGSRRCVQVRWQLSNEFGVEYLV